jgi:hypothetical protein
MKPIFLLLVSAVLSIPAYARLGETEAECIRRYGDPIGRKDSSKLVIFSKNGLLITVQFHKGRADYISYRKHREYPDPYWFSETEISTLLKANGRGQKWEMTQSPRENGNHWVTEDRSLSAITWEIKENREDVLAILTSGNLNRGEAAREAEERKQIEGL